MYVASKTSKLIVSKNKLKTFVVFGSQLSLVFGICYHFIQGARESALAGEPFYGAVFDRPSDLRRACSNHLWQLLADVFNVFQRFCHEPPHASGCHRPTSSDGSCVKAIHRIRPTSRAALSSMSLYAWMARVFSSKSRFVLMSMAIV